MASRSFSSSSWSCRVFQLRFVSVITAFKGMGGSFQHLVEQGLAQAAEHQHRLGQGLGRLAGLPLALGQLRQRDDVKWTYVSPAGDFQAEGERTGSYILGGEELTLNSKAKICFSLENSGAEH